MKQTLITTYNTIYAKHTDSFGCFVLMTLLVFLLSPLLTQAKPECQRLRSLTACIIGHFNSYLFRKHLVDRSPFYRYFFFYGGFHVVGLYNIE